MKPPHPPARSRRPAPPQNAASIASRFRDLHGLELAVKQEVRELGRAQAEATQELQRLQVRERERKGASRRVGWEVVVPVPPQRWYGSVVCVHARVESGQGDCFVLAACPLACQPALMLILQAACRAPPPALVELAATCSRCRAETAVAGRVCPPLQAGGAVLELGGGPACCQPAASLLPACVCLCVPVCRAGRCACPACLLPVCCLCAGLGGVGPGPACCPSTTPGAPRTSCKLQSARACRHQQPRQS